MKFLYLTITLMLGGLLFYGVPDMPHWGDINSPPSKHVSPRYIEKATSETEVPNLVTAVLADYRSFDTFGETAVIFTGGLACLIILRDRKEKKGAIS